MGILGDLDVPIPLSRKLGLPDLKCLPDWKRGVQDEQRDKMSKETR